MKFYGLWIPKGGVKAVQECLDTGVWYRGDCPDEKYEKEKIAKMPIGADVFLYEGIDDVKLADSPFAEFMSSDEYDLNHTTVKVKCYSIGKVVQINSDGMSIQIDWDKDYQSVEWFSYFRQNGVWVVHNNKNIANELEKIIFHDKKQNYQSLIQSYFKKYKKSRSENMEQRSENMPLNQILYGAPGTGKTYSTVGKALDILEATDDQKQDIKSIGKLKEVFGSQVEFVTFHQSFSYEDFVEGIKAELNNDGELSYDVKPGIFKEICKNANVSGNVSIKALDNAIQELMEQVEEEPLRLETLAQSKPFTLTYNGGNAFYAKPDSGKWNNPASIKAIVKLYENPDIKSGDDGVHFKIYTMPIIQYLKENFDLQNYQETNDKKPHILIIDEINRGNISRIFGELITLIEPSKRAGENEEISVKLPYSKESFSVPNNLHIIGTMNTADRSLTLMDTALRRRFDFIEMLPDVDLVKGIFDGIEVRKILEIINKRIEILYDREHLIGHSFLMNVENLEQLQNAFKNKILPLLEEYFYDDFEKINLVLGSDDFYKKSSKTLGDISKDIYRKQDIDNLTAETFCRIYKTQNPTDTE